MVHETGCNQMFTHPSSCQLSPVNEVKVSQGHGGRPITGGSGYRRSSGHTLLVSVVVGGGKLTLKLKQYKLRCKLEFQGTGVSLLYRNSPHVQEFPLCAGLSPSSCTGVPLIYRSSLHVQEFPSCTGVPFIYRSPPPTCTGVALCMYKSSPHGQEFSYVQEYPSWLYRSSCHVQESPGVQEFLYVQESLLVYRSTSSLCAGAIYMIVSLRLANSSPGTKRPLNLTSPSFCSPSFHLFRATFQSFSWHFLGSPNSCGH